MKRKIRLICLFLSLLFLTACGNAESVGKNSGMEALEKSANAESVKAAAPVNASDAENNGGCYVRVGGKVYFRKYGPDALNTLATFGEFTSAWNAAGGESEIMSYDLTTGQVETAFKDTGYGGLYVGDGRLYLQERINGADYVVRYAFDGAESETIAEGTLLGLTDSGLLAVERSQGAGDSFYFFRDGKEIASYSLEESMIFAGLSDDGLFLLRMDYKSETDAGEGAVCALWQWSPDGEFLCLGTLPESEYMYGIGAEQFVTAENQIGLVVGYYAGTGHALNDFAVVTATPGLADSLNVLEAETYDPENLPKLTLDDAGNIAVVPYLYGDLQIGWGDEDNGDLQLYDGFQWTTLQENFCPYRTDGAGYAKITQNIEYLDGAAYVTLAAAYASPLDDIGWRSAYALLDMLYFVVPASEGEARELACVEYDTTLVGNVWFQDGETSLLWRQSAMDPDAWNPEADFAFLIPISPAAVWENKDEILLNAVRAKPQGTPEYYGYPVPDTEGQFLCLRLNRDGEAVFLTAKSPDTLLTIDVGVTEAELSDAVTKIELTRRPSDEDIPWQWAKLTARENGVTLRIERTPDNETETEEVAMQEGLFVPGETLLQRVLNRGESVGLYASLPWRPEIRVSVMRNGTYGDYIFGEDNYLHEEPVNGRYAQKIVAGYPLEDGGLTGQWLYRDPLTKAHTVRLNFEEDSTLAVAPEDSLYWLTWGMERLYAEEWEQPDLLCLEATEPETVAAVNMEGGAGDYYVERFQTDGETIARLVQANNGDAALETLIPHQSQWLTEITLHRYFGVADAAAPLRNVTLTARVAKVDAERNVIWLREAEAETEVEYEGMEPRFFVKPYAPCVSCPLASVELLAAFAQCLDSAYPMAVFQVTVDRDGFVTSLDAPTIPAEP